MKRLSEIPLNKIITGMRVKYLERYGTIVSTSTISFWNTFGVVNIQWDLDVNVCSYTYMNFEETPDRQSLYNVFVLEKEKTTKTVDIEEIVSRCTYPGFELKVRYDGNRPYLQVHCKDGVDNDTGKPVSWTGRKWMLSPHMVPNEIVNTAFKAVMAAVEHETRENFKYRNEAIFNPHIDPDKLVDFVRNRDNIQERPNALQAV